MDTVTVKVVCVLFFAAVLILLMGLSTKEAQKAAAPKPKPKNPVQERAKRREEARRIRTTCSFSDGVSKELFAGFVRKAGTNVDRLDSLSVDGAVVNGTVWDQSGKSKWKFCLDFNDFGHLTGRYWKYTENKGSMVPDYVGYQIQTLLQDCCRLKKTDLGHGDLSTPVVYGRKPENKLVVTAVMLVAAAVLVVVIQVNRPIPIFDASDAFVGMNGSAAVRLLEEEGFWNVRLVQMEDLEAEEIHRTGQVTRISVEGETDFDREKFVPYADIVVFSHSLRNISPTVFAGDVIGMNWEEAAAALSRDGFVNICPVAVPDSFLNLFYRDGAVIGVTIDGDSDFSPDSAYDPDVEICIRYSGSDREE